MDGAEGAAREADATNESKAPLFARFDDADIRALVESYPLAWVCGGSAGVMDASLLPLIGMFDASGRLTELIGHLMRSNPLYATLSRDPASTILFNGPNAYVSPEHAGRRDWAPTWNYAQLTIGAEIMFDAALTEYSLQILIDAMESGRARPWDAAELGPRYDAMLERIIGFRARVTSLRGKFKLGQDEDSETLHAIVDGHPDAATVEWMRRFNKGR